jgi:predicted peroxiredoxin
MQQKEYFMKLKTLLNSLLLATVCFIPATTFAADNAAKGLFVVVTSADPQTQMMAMVLSGEVLGKGKSVEVLLCNAGGDLALKNSEEVLLKPKNKSPNMLLKSLIEKGVTVQVCPLYLPNKGATPEDMIKGVSQAEPAVVAEKLLQPDINLLTF